MMEIRVGQLSQNIYLQAKGISVESFLRTQAELMEKFDSGFSGYRGLSGKLVWIHLMTFV